MFVKLGKDQNGIVINMDTTDLDKINHLVIKKDSVITKEALNQALDNFVLQIPGTDLKENENGYEITYKGSFRTQAVLADNLVKIFTRPHEYMYGDIVAAHIAVNLAAKVFMSTTNTEMDPKEMFFDTDSFMDIEDTDNN